MKYVCDNCRRTGEAEDFNQAKDLHLRIEAGSIYTERECGDCGCLAYPESIFREDTEREIVDVPLLYRQKWELCRLQRLHPETEDLLEGLINYMDDQTDRLDPDDTIRNEIMRSAQRVR